MMIRTQISLDAEVHARLRAKAAELGISFAEHVRRLAARDLGVSPSPGDISVIFDLGGEQESDIAADKDRMIGEAIALRKADLPNPSSTP